MPIIPTQNPRYNPGQTSGRWLDYLVQCSNRDSNGRGGQDNVRCYSSSEEFVHNGGEVRPNFRRNRIYVAVQTLEEMDHEIGIGFHGLLVFEDVFARLNGLELVERCMKIISRSKGGQKPFLSILKNGGSVTLNPTEKILPELLKKVGGIEGLVQRGEDGVIKMGTKMLKHDTLSLID